MKIIAEKKKLTRLLLRIVSGFIVATFTLVVFDYMFYGLDDIKWKEDMIIGIFASLAVAPLNLKRL